MSTGKRKRYKNSITISIIHVLVWVLLFVFNYLFINNYRIQFDFWFHTKIWCIYAIVFYLNYFLLMPFFFFVKKFIFYALLSLVLLAGTYIIKKELEITHFERIRKEFVPEMQFQFAPLKPPPMEGRPFNIPIHGPRKEFIFLSLSGLLLIYTASISIRLIEKWKTDEKRATEIEKEKISTELSFLKQQINPHFLFNSLNSIYSLSLSKSESANSSILKLSSILRYVLYESSNNPVNLKNELAIVNDYIELQKLRLTEKVNLKYSVTSETENYLIEPFILIPLIENAFKYGTDSINDSFIDICITIADQILTLNIDNNIADRMAGMNSDSGIGIKNIKRRLELLYPEKHEFHYDEKDNVFSIQLKLHLNK